MPSPDDPPPEYGYWHGPAGAEEPRLRRRVAELEADNYALQVEVARLKRELLLRRPT